MGTLDNKDRANLTRENLLFKYKATKDVDKQYIAAADLDVCGWELDRLTRNKSKIGRCVLKRHITQIITSTLTHEQYHKQTPHKHKYNWLAKIERDTTTLLQSKLPRRTMVTIHRALS